MNICCREEKKDVLKVPRIALFRGSCKQWQAFRVKNGSAVLAPATLGIMNDNEAEITLRIVAELTFAVRDATGEIIEGDPNTIKRQKDVWTFARTMGADDPNWQLVATGD